VHGNVSVYAMRRQMADFTDCAQNCCRLILFHFVTAGATRGHFHILAILLLLNFHCTDLTLNVILRIHCAVQLLQVEIAIELLNLGVWLVLSDLKDAKLIKFKSKIFQISQLTLAVEVAGIMIILGVPVPTFGAPTRVTFFCPGAS
jgi:hypothetical protein